MPSEIQIMKCACVGKRFQLSENILYLWLYLSRGLFSLVQIHAQNDQLCTEKITSIYTFKSFSMSYINDSAVRKTENFLSVSWKWSNSVQGTGQTRVRRAGETSRGQWWDPDGTRVGKLLISICRGLLKALDLGKVKADLGSSRL